MQELFHYSYLIRIVICFAVGLSLLFLDMAPYLNNPLYIKTKRWIAISTIVFAIGNIYVFIYDSENLNINIIPFPYLLFACFQNLLFSTIVLVMFHSSRATKAHIFRYLLPTIILAIAYCIITIFGDDIVVVNFDNYIKNIGNPALIVRTLLLINYAVQLWFCILLFRKERKIFVDKINDYFSNIEQINLRVGSVLFYQATTISVFVLIFCIYPTMIGDIILSIMVIIFYFKFSIRYVNYQYKLLYHLPAFEIKEVEKAIDITKNISSEIGEKIIYWMDREDKPYLAPGITLDDVARMIDESKRELSKHINTKYNLTFNCWINSLRIDEAVRLINEGDENLTLTDIAYLTGFADLPMMGKYFRKIKGKSPSFIKKAPKTA